MLSWDRVHFREDIEEAVTELFETAVFVFEHLPAPFAFSRIPKQLDYETEVTDTHLTELQLPDVYWLTLFSEQVCVDIDPSRVKTMPVWKGESLDGDGVGFVVTDSPFDYRREDKHRVREYLGFEN